MPNPISHCPIWGREYFAQGLRHPRERVIEVTDSPRAGGAFQLDYDVEDRLKFLNQESRLLLTSWLVEQWVRGDKMPEVTVATLESIRNRRSLQPYERADNLLRLLARKTPRVGDFMKITSRSATGNNGPDEPDCRLAMAWSESTSIGEVDYFLNYLTEKQWTKSSYPAHTVTVEGHSHIADLQINVDSSQAFVAMWFNEEMKEAYDKGIEPAVKEAGYSALIINRKDYLGKVEDEIIAQIRRSRFLVADFTHGDDGVRGGVYYEAGFAEGLNLPVIYMCRKDKVDSDPNYLHFDTSHQNHILWTDVADLREKLKNRIERVIGQGPET